MAFASRTVCLLLVALALCQAATAQPTEKDQIVTAFKDITTLSDNLRVVTSGITLINAPLQGYKIAQGFSLIIQRVTPAVTMLANAASNPALGDADAQIVVDALTTFVRVHQALLNVVIGKHGLLTLIPFFEPIRQALVSLENIVDTFAFRLIARIPTQEAAAKGQFASLTITVDLAITTYEQPL